MLVAAAFFASACQHDSSANFDDANLPSAMGGSDGAGGPAATAGEGTGGSLASGGSKASAGGSSGGKGSGGASGSASGGKPNGAAGKAGAEAGGTASEAGTAGSTATAGGGMGGSGGKPSDPTPVTIEITAFEDTSVASCQLNDNFAKGPTIFTDRDPNCVLQGLINPSLQSIPDGAVVSDATLTLECVNIGGVVAASYVLDSWAEDTARWNNRPDIGSLIDTFTCEKLGPVTIDLTTAVQVWLSGQQKPYGIYLSTEDNDGTDFASSEAADSSTRPTLSVTYTLPMK